MSEEEAVLNTEETAEEKPAELSDEEAAQAKLKEAVQVEVEDIGPLRKKLTITVPRETIDERLKAQFDELRHEAQVPGFRRGRAPQRLIEKRFGSEVGDQVGTSLIGNSFLAATEKVELEPLGDPLVHVKITEERADEGGRVRKVEVEKLLPLKEAIDHISLPKDGPLVFTCEMELKPKFELPNLEKIPVERPKLQVADEDVDGEVRRLMMFRATYKPVESGKVEADDLVVANTKFIAKGDVVKAEDNVELAARDQTYAGLRLEGLGEKIVGRKSGDKISLAVTVPEDHTNVDLRGQAATFEVEVLDIKRLDVPTVDDQTVQAMGFESVDELRKFIRERMESEIAGVVQEGLRNRIAEYLLEKTDFEVPGGISQRLTEQIVARKMMEQYERGVHESEIAKEADEWRSAAAEQARTELKLLFIMEKIAEVKEVSVSEEEVNSVIGEIARRRNRRFDRVRDEIISSGQLTTLYLRLRDRKIFDLLLEGAEITEKEIAKKRKA